MQNGTTRPQVTLNGRLSRNSQKSSTYKELHEAEATCRQQQPRMVNLSRSGVKARLRPLSRFK
eukprot:3394902-Alexandrium_andersonii.AAC.1